MTGSLRVQGRGRRRWRLRRGADAREGHQHRRTEQGGKRSRGAQRSLLPAVQRVTAPWLVGAGSSARLDV